MKEVERSIISVRSGISTFSRGTTPLAGRKLRFAPFIETYGDYFHALGIPLIAGRSFTVRDRSDAPLVCIVDQSMAKEEWPGQDPIGKRLHIGNPKRSLPWATVVTMLQAVFVTKLSHNSARPQSIRNCCSAMKSQKSNSRAKCLLQTRPH